MEAYIPMPDKPEPIKCECGEYARQHEVKKEGANQGRTFYCCHAYPKECNFFKWEKDTPSLLERVEKLEEQLRQIQKKRKNPFQ